IDRARGLVPLAEVPLVEAKRATDQAAKLARDMLTFARSQPGHIGPVYVNDLLGRVVAVASAELPSGVRIVNASATDLPPALVDTAHLEQVVRELVSNACDAVGGGGTVSVSASLVDAARCHLRDDLGPAARYVMVTVADDGPGIPSELMSKVWEPFFTTKSLSTEHGTGLGLSTAHGIVHQYGGHIRLDSGPGHGTTVSFYLPVAETSGG
ncbi:MAG: ATP-binding protein, partial [Actinomycetota bacterium]